MPHMDYAIQVLQMVVDDVGDDVCLLICVMIVFMSLVFLFYFVLCRACLSYA